LYGNTGIWPRCHSASVTPAANDGVTNLRRSARLRRSSAEGRNRSSSVSMACRRLAVTATVAGVLTISAGPADVGTGSLDDRVGRIAIAPAIAPTTTTAATTRPVSLRRRGELNTSEVITAVF
jgi:hypothetical protein